MKNFFHFNFQPNIAVNNDFTVVQGLLSNFLNLISNLSTKFDIRIRNFLQGCDVHCI